MMSPRSDAAASDPPEECETLLPLFAGPTGPVQLGRCLKGENANRITLLRRVMPIEVPNLEEAIERASSVASPQLLKVLGLFRKQRARYVASEYIEGVALCELHDVRRQEGIPADVAARVIQEALSAAHTAAQRLQEGGAHGFRRYIFPDTVWITEFGITLLTEVGIAQRISLSPIFEANESKRGAFTRAPDTDVQVAALELRKLLTLHSVSPSPIARPLQEIIERALSRSPRDAFSGPSAMAEALAELPGSLLADERRVGRAVQSLLRPTLDARRQRLAEILDTGDRGTLDEPTASYRSHTGSVHEAARSVPYAEASRIVSAVPAPSRLPFDSRNADPDGDADETTRVYRPKSVSDPEVVTRSEAHARISGTGVAGRATVPYQPMPQNLERESGERPTRYLQLELEDDPEGVDGDSRASDDASGRGGRSVATPMQLGTAQRTFDGVAQASVGRERIWRAIALMAMATVAVLCAGRWLGFW